MRTDRFTVVALTVAIVCGVVLSAGQARPQEVRLQAAIRLEIVDANLPAAIDAFQAIIRDFQKDRRIVATATLHLADCYRKQGEVKAQALYEEVTVRFRDLPEAALARVQLDKWQDDLPGQHHAWTEPLEASLLGDVSINGRLLAYVDWSDRGRGDVFIQSIGGRSPRRLVSSEKDTAGNTTATASDGVFSPDGRELAFNWYGPTRKSAELRVVPVAGGKVQLLFSGPDVCCLRPLAWSPDSKSIAAILQKRDSSAQLALISTVTGEVRQLKPLTWRRPSRAAFSPDGRLLAFDLQGAETNAREIFAIRLGDGAELPLITYRGNDALVGFAPDGSLVFTTDRTGSTGLWTAPMSGDTAGPSRPLRGDLGQFSPSGMTATGSIYYCRCEPERGSDIRMGIFDISTGNFSNSLVDAVQEFVGTNSQPFWSPDGKTFVYRSIRGANRDPVLAIRAPGQEPRELRPKLRSLIDPRWSPDGSFVAVLGTDFEGRYGFFKIDVKEATVAPIVLGVPGDTFYVSEPATTWSADGKRMYFRRLSKTDFSFVEWDLVEADEKILLSLRDHTTRGVYLASDGILYYMNPVIDGRTTAFMTRRDLATGQEKELIRGPVVQGINPSPDGRWIATATGTGTKRTTLTLIPVNGGPPRDIWKVDGDFELGEPGVVPAMNSWAPDSQSIVVAKVLPNDGGYEYWWIPIDGRKAHVINELHGLHLPGRFRFHPDGRTVVFAANDVDTSASTPTELWVFEDLVARAIAKR